MSRCIIWTFATHENAWLRQKCQHDYFVSQMINIPMTTYLSPICYISTVSCLQLIKRQKRWHIGFRSLETHEIDESSSDVSKACFGKGVAEFDTLWQPRPTDCHRNLLFKHMCSDHPQKRLATNSKKRLQHSITSEQFA